MSDQTSHERTALENAWIRFATFDHNAKVLQARFFRLRGAILWMGVLATALAIFYSQYVDTSGRRPAFDEWQFYVWLAMTMAPILSTVLSTGASKLARGVDWVTLRGAAEATKREIYRFRCAIDCYDRSGCTSEQRAETLSTTVGNATSRLMDTDVLQSSMMGYAGELPPKYGAAPGDDGFCDIDPEHYLEWRLGDQLAFFVSKARSLDRRHHRTQWAIAGLGGLGTLLATVGQEIWLPAAVGVSTALTSYLQLRNVEPQLAGYNRAGLELTNVATWWSGLPDNLKAEPAKFAILVERTETVLTSENASWVQDMQAAVAKIHEDK